MEKITHISIGFLALSTMCGVLLHDTNVDKAAVHVVGRINGTSDASVNVSSHAHTHSERSALGGKTQPSIARDPREDKARHQDQTDYFRLPSSADFDNTLVLV